MRFLIEIFYFSLVHYYVVTESHDVFTFNAISLGHSGLLITWKPNITTPSENTSIYYFTFHLYSNIVGEQNDESSTSEVHQLYSPADEDNDCSKPKYRACKGPEGSYKLHSLNESTLYEVIVKQYTNNYSHVNTYSVKMRTNWKSKRTPAKPYFEFIPYVSNPSVGMIRWYPCGRERICHDQESGTHFGITIKEPYSTRKLSEVKRDEFYNDYRLLFFLPGRRYEVVVYSVNGECKTDSDSQEMFFNPMQYVKVISLPDLSILISWRPPKQLLENELLSYLVFSMDSSYSNADEGFNSFSHSDFHLIRQGHRDLANTGNASNQMRIFSLIPEVIYTFIIVPKGELGLGFEYQMEYKLQVYDHDLPIAKPDFDYKLRRYSTECRFNFQWLPCGRSFDCENTKPGSKYSFQVKPKPRDENYQNMTGCYRGTFDFDLVYDVTIKSSIGSNFSGEVTKKFKNCEEI